MFFSACTTTQYYGGKMNKNEEDVDVHNNNALVAKWENETTTKKLCCSKSKKRSEMRSDKKNRSFIEFLFLFEVYYRRYSTTADGGGGWNVKSSGTRYWHITKFNCFKQFYADYRAFFMSFNNLLCSSLLIITHSPAVSALIRFLCLLVQLLSQIMFVSNQWVAWWECTFYKRSLSCNSYCSCEESSRKLAYLSRSTVSF